jgi:hypothetical protein
LGQLGPELPNPHQLGQLGLSDLLGQALLIVRLWHLSDLLDLSDQLGLYHQWGRLDRALLTVHLWHQLDRLGHPDQSGLLFHSDRLARSGHLDLYFLLDL